MAAARLSAPTGAAAVGLDQGAQVATVHAVQPRLVHLQPRQAAGGDGAVDDVGALRVGEVADAAQEAPGHARGAAAAPGDLRGAVDRQLDPHAARGVVQHALQLLGRVELQPQRDAEAVAQGLRGQQARAGGGAPPG